MQWDLCWDNETWLKASAYWAVEACLVRALIFSIFSVGENDYGREHNYAFAIFNLLNLT